MAWRAGKEPAWSRCSDNLKGLCFLSVDNSDCGILLNPFKDGLHKRATRVDAP